MHIEALDNRFLELQAKFEYRGNLSPLLKVSKHFQRNVRRIVARTESAIIVAIIEYPKCADGLDWLAIN